MTWIPCDGRTILESDAPDLADTGICKTVDCNGLVCLVIPDMRPVPHPISVSPGIILVPSIRLEGPKAGEIAHVI